MSGDKNSKLANTAMNIFAVLFFSVVVVSVIGSAIWRLNITSTYQNWRPDRNLEIHEVAGKFVENTKLPRSLPFRFMDASGAEMSFVCRSSRGGDGARHPNNCLMGSVADVGDFSGKSVYVKYYVARFNNRKAFDNVIIKITLDKEVIFQQSLEESYQIR